MYVCMHVRMYVGMYMRTCTVSVCTYVRMYIRTCVRMYVRTHVSMYVRTRGKGGGGHRGYTLSGRYKNKVLNDPCRK